MEIDTVRKLLTDVGLSHSKESDSKELEALRKISLALLHIAEAVHGLERREAERNRGPK